MAAILSGIKGRFILSINDKPEVRRIFKGFEIESVKLKYSVGGGKRVKDAAALIITGRS